MLRGVQFTAAECGEQNGSVPGTVLIKGLPTWDDTACTQLCLLCIFHRRGEAVPGDVAQSASEVPSEEPSHLA